MASRRPLKSGPRRVEAPRSGSARSPVRSIRHSHWSRLLTESRNPKSINLDRMATEKVVTLLLDEDRLAMIAAKKKARDVASAARLMANSLAAGGRTIFVGAGNSGRLGVLEAAECPSTFGTRPETVVGIVAGGDEAVFRTAAGSEDREDLGEKAVAAVTSKDLVVGISASSVTPFVRGALRRARKRRAKTVLITCAPRNGLSALAGVVIAIRTGPEVLTGSTRLKAGSATKAVLNAITTAAMIRAGNVYSNFMVDFKQTSKKLEDRARRIVSLSVGVDPIEADRLLRVAGQEVKAAIVMGVLGQDAKTARRRLRLAKGHVRKAINGARRK